jgi:hypothetical protein
MTVFTKDAQYVRMPIVYESDLFVNVFQCNMSDSKRMHNICLDNCHSHVAKCLNLMNYAGDSYSMISIGVWFFFQGKFTSTGAVVKTYLPFVILIVFLLWVTDSFGA